MSSNVFNRNMEQMVLKQEMQHPKTERPDSEHDNASGEEFSKKEGINEHLQAEPQLWMEQRFQSPAYRIAWNHFAVAASPEVMLVPLFIRAQEAQQGMQQHPTQMVNEPDYSSANSDHASSSVQSDGQFDSDEHGGASPDPNGYQKYKRVITPIKKKAKEHPCSDCNMIFASKIALHRHLETHGTLSRPKFPCEVCGREYLSKYTLITHMEWHTGAVVHACGECGKRFSSKGNLKTHEMNVHDWERSCRYSCNMCNEKFATKKQLSIHSRTPHHDSVSQMWNTSNFNRGALQNQNILQDKYLKTYPPAPHITNAPTFTNEES